MLGHVEDFRGLPARRGGAARRSAARAGPAGAALPRRAFDGRLHRAPDAARAGGVLRRDLLGADVAPADEGGDPRADREMTQLANLMGLGARLMPGTRARPTALAVGFAGNALTSDAETFAWCVDQITAHPELALGGPSMQWTYAALEEMARLYVAPLPRLPMLVLLGDRGDGGLGQRDPQPGGADGAGRAGRARRAPGTRSSWSGRRSGRRCSAGSTLSWSRSRRAAAMRRRPVPERCGRAAAGRPSRPDQATSLRTRARSKSRRRCASGIE